MAPIEKHMRIVIFKWAPIRCTPSTRVDLSTDDDRPDKIRPPSRYRNMYESMSTYRVKTATARHDPHIASTHVAIFATATGRSQRCLTASGHRYSVCHLVVRDGNGCYRHSQSPIQIERGLRLFCLHRDARIFELHDCVVVVVERTERQSLRIDGTAKLGDHSSCRVLLLRRSNST